MDYLFEKITENIRNHDNTIIMTHRHPDLDGMSSAVCLYEVIKSFKKEVYVVVPTEIVNNSLKKGLDYLRKKIDIAFITYPDVLEVISDKTLLIVLDTQKPVLVQFKELLNIKDILVIDHHVNSSIHIENTLFEYINSNKSSVVEIMVEYLKYLNFDLNEYAATLMLAGIDIDTHSYSLKTTSNTFLAASFLLDCGASLEIKNELLKESREDVLKRNRNIDKSYFIKKGFLLCDMGSVEETVDLAILADELLRLDGVQVSFTVGRILDTVYVSARSMGKISVSVIMSALGGGGHVTDAACEFKNKTNEEVIKMIKDIVLEV